MTTLLARYLPAGEWPSLSSLVAVLATMAAIIVAFHVEAFGVFERWWHDPTYSHGLLLAPMTLVLILLSGGLRVSKQGVDWLPVIATLGIGGMMMVGSLLGIATVFQLLMPLLLLCALLIVFGRGAWPALWFPVLYLYFSIPIWDALNPLLQALTTHAVERMIFAAGVPAFISGNFVTVSAGVFEVAEGCSGLRFFIISLAVASLYAYLYLRGTRASLGFILFSAALAIVGNWIRVFIVILIGMRLGIDHPYVTNHGSVGWIVFAVTMLILFGLAGRFSHRDEQRSQTEQPENAAPRLPVALAPALLIVGLFASVSTAASMLASQAPQRLATLDWLQPGERRAACDGWRTEMRGADDERRGVTRAAGSSICADIVFYSRQRQGSELINTSNRLYPKDGRMQVMTKRRFVDDGVEAVILGRAARESLVVVYQYRIAGSAVFGGARAKLRQLEGLLRGRTDGVLVAYAMRCDESCVAAVDAGRLPVAMSEAIDKYNQEKFTVAAGS